MSNFKIDNVDLFSTLKIKVLKADGLDIVPTVKKREEKSWPEESGVDVDPTTVLTYEPVDIFLACYVQDSTYNDCIKKINALIKILSASGYHILNSVARERLYPVLFTEISGYQPRTSINATKVAITFTVKLRMPKPECRMGSATVINGGEVSLNAQTNKEVIVWWGDGSSSTGTGVLEHTYANAGTYTILIAGTGVTSSTFTVTGIDIEDYYYIPE